MNNISNQNTSDQELPDRISPEAPTVHELPEHTDSLTATAWIEEYKRFILQENKTPRSVYELTHFVDVEEESFYEVFGGLNALSQRIWSEYYDQTTKRLTSEAVYLDYGVREKLLAFYFTLLEVLKRDRSFIKIVMKEGLLPDWSPSFLDTFRKQYSAFVKGLVREGKETGEVADRMFISNQYDKPLWLQFLFILNFWLKDESQNFEKTDAAIEKSVNLSLDLMGKSPLDSLTDFAKFLYQSRKRSS